MVVVVVVVMVAVVVVMVKGVEALASVLQSKDTVAAVQRLQCADRAVSISPSLSFFVIKVLNNVLDSKKADALEATSRNGKRKTAVRVEAGLQKSVEN